MGSPGRERGGHSGSAGGGTGDTTGVPVACWGLRGPVPATPARGGGRGGGRGRQPSQQRAESTLLRAASCAAAPRLGMHFPRQHRLQPSGGIRTWESSAAPCSPPALSTRFPGKGRGFGAVPGGLLRGLAPTRSHARTSLAHSSFVLRADLRVGGPRRTFHRPSATTLDPEAR